jgi:hypothetical protein
MGREGEGVEHNTGYGTVQYREIPRHSNLGVCVMCMDIRRSLIFGWCVYE